MNDSNVNSKPTNYNDNFELIYPCPTDAPERPESLPYKINDKWVWIPIKFWWAYRDQPGRLLGYVVRIERETGKETPMVTLWRDKRNGRLKWRARGFPAPRPLYNLEIVSKHPQAQIVIVEGEKCAECLQAVIDGIGARSSLVAVTWPGGTNGISKGYWLPIAGRKTILWPDADEPGKKAMIELAQDYLSPFSDDIKIMDIPGDKPKGWDVADAVVNDGWQINDIIKFMKNTSRQFEPKPKADKEKTEKINVVKPDDFPFRCLGISQGNYYYLPYNTNNIKIIKGENHGCASLMTLAPLWFWERNFEGNSGPAWKIASDTLMRLCEREGVFDGTNLRGRGAWIDAKTTVLQMGNKLIVDGEYRSIRDFKSRYCYEAGPAIEVSAANPISAAEAITLRKITDLLFWERPISSIYLAGWCVIAPICGALRNRPHLWITGAAGTGKTHILEHIVAPCLGDFAIFASQDTTDAGIRQMLGSDARPVMLDEFEAEAVESQSRIQKMLELARQAFSDTGAKIIKGSAGHGAVFFQVRSCFLMSSIGVAISQRADQSRVMILGLKPPKNTEGEGKEEHFQRLCSITDATLTEAFCQGLRARSFAMVNTIRKNTEIFSSVISRKTGNRRHADLIAPLLAGNHALMYDHVVHADEARAFVDSQDFSSQLPEDHESDEIRLLNNLMSFTVRQPGSEDISVYELIMDAHSRKAASGGCDENSQEQLTVSRLGFRVTETDLIVADGHPKIKGMLEKTPWLKTYSGIISRIKDAEKIKMVRFCGSRYRAISIPLSALPEKQITTGDPGEF